MPRPTDDIQRRLRAAEQHLAAVDPVMADVIARYGPCGLGAKVRDPFHTLCSSIISQQLSSRAADTIQARVMMALSAAEVLRPEHLLAASLDELRACGLSQAKAKWLRHLGEAAQAGTLDFEVLRTLDDEAAIEALDALPGIGRWTAEMFLIFAMHRLDLFAMDDVGLLRGLRMLYSKTNRPLAERTIRTVTRRWSPYRSVASWYLWRVADPVNVTWA